MRILTPLILLLLTSCSRLIINKHPFPERRVKTVSTPIYVRIKIHTFREQLHIRLKTPYIADGISLKPGDYTLKLSHARKSKFIYYETLYKTPDYDSAYMYFLNHRASDVYFIDVGTILKIGTFTLDNREFLVLKGPFKDERKLIQPYAEPINPPHAVIEIFDRYNRKIISTRDSLILKSIGGTISLGEYKNLTGEVTVTVDTKGRGVVILKIELEDYIKSVLPSEMPPDFPQEALKAQAVVARTFALANLGKYYRYQPFDFTSTTLSQVFKGKRFEISDDIVERTKGIVLFYNGRIANVFYHSTCGGHTENIKYIWTKREIPYLKGVKDGDFHYNLQNPVDVRMFIEQPPESVYCRLTKNSTIKYYARKNFRWRVRIPRKQIEKQIRKFTGHNIGKLTSIIPIKRGVSGRITEILFTGTNRNVYIKGEYKIREILGGLKSSLFIIDYQRDSKGNIVSVILTGGGAGHGVGLCQVGAGILAEHGYKMEDIINHYFPGVKGVKLY